MALNDLGISLRPYLKDARIWTAPASNGHKSGLSGVTVSLHDLRRGLEDAKLRARIPEDEFHTHLPYVGHVAQVHNRTVEAAAEAILDQADEVVQGEGDETADPSQRIAAATLLQILSAVVKVPLESTEPHATRASAKARGAAQLVAHFLIPFAGQIPGRKKASASVDVLRCGMDLLSAAMPLGDLQMPALRMRMDDAAGTLRELAIDAGAAAGLELRAQK